MPSEHYFDTAQICPNGHVATNRYGDRPATRKPFCDRCGEPTACTCGQCHQPIRGREIKPSGAVLHYQAPAFCDNCGTVFPWTERQKQAALDLFLDQVQDEEDRRLFAESLEQIAKDTPQAVVAAGRVGKLLKEVGAEVGGAIRKIALDLASEAAKGMLKG